MLSGTSCSRTDCDEFSDELSRLKRQGASVLVVGSVQPDQRLDAGRRLMGCATDRVRRRVLVSTTGTLHCGSQFVGDVDAGTLSVIRYDAQTQSPTPSSGTAPTPAPSMEASDPSTTDVDTLGDLGIAISKALDDFEADADELEPAEVRIAIDSLLPLLEEYGKQRLFKFLHLINGRTADIGGMAHHHLSIDRDAEVVPLLSPLFDVVLELRERNGDRQERWIIGDGDQSSGWLSVDRA